MNIIEILEQYESSGKRKIPLGGTCYHFANRKGDYLEISIFNNGKSIRYLDDNFPAQRRYFMSDIPVKTIEEFESDLKRMKIEIPTRK